MRSCGYGRPGPEVERDPAASGPSTRSRTGARAGAAVLMEKLEVAEKGKLAQGPDLLPSGLVKTVCAETSKHSTKWGLGCYASAFKVCLHSSDQH